MSFNDIIKIIDEIQASYILLLCHHNSDPDAVCSAYGLQSLLKKVRPNLTAEIGTGQGVSRLTKNLLKYIPITVNLSPNAGKAQAFILLDTNTIQQLGNLADQVLNASVPKIVIDHHAAHPNTQKICRLCIINEEAASTCDIVYRFFREEKIKPEPDQAKALFLGMAFDTRHFILANSSTFKSVAELADLGVNAQEALSMLALPMDFSERIARVKACRRSKIILVDNWILAFSHVSAFQASAARALTDLGAHMAVVAGKKGESLEISMRCTREFSEKTGIHIGKDVAKPLGEDLSGMGGGHALAAGVNAKGEIAVALKQGLNIIKKNLAKIE